jgi:FeS assembly SUF system protein
VIPVSIPKGTFLIPPESNVNGSDSTEIKPIVIKDNPMITKEMVKEKLRECYDPEIPINIVDLGLVYDIQIQAGAVRVQMTLTARGCPMAGFFVEEVKKKLREIEGVTNTDVELVWDPPWSPERISDEAKNNLGFK